MRTQKFAEQVDNIHRYRKSESVRDGGNKRKDSPPIR